MQACKHPQAHASYTHSCLCGCVCLLVCNVLNSTSSRVSFKIKSNTHTQTRTSAQKRHTRSCVKRYYAICPLPWTMSRIVSVLAEINHAIYVCVYYVYGPLSSPSPSSHFRCTVYMLCVVVIARNAQRRKYSRWRLGQRQRYIIYIYIH